MNTKHIDHENPNTIPKILKKINPNYVTAHFGKWHIDVDPKILGYDIHDGKNGNKNGKFVNNKTQWINEFSDNPKNIFSLSEKAMDFIENQNELEKPFYLQISHYAIHSDLIMRKETYEKYNDKIKGKIHNNVGLAAMTEDLDSSIGFIMEKLKELGIEDNTYIIYSSDNGSVPIISPNKDYEISYNFPLKRGKWDAMEGGIRVPFIISGPKIKEN